MIKMRSSSSTTVETPPPALPGNIYPVEVQCRHNKDGLNELLESLMSDVRIFIDSGAFSAWRLGCPVDLSAYCNFLMENSSWIDAAAALDVIIPDDPEEAARQSFENLKFMRACGLDPIPVWHVRESTDWIYRMLDLGCGYVGLSATSIVSMRAADDWYESAWSHLVDSDGAPLVRVHSFGESRLEILQKYPWASADSSTWLEGEKRGTMILPSGRWVGHTKRMGHSPSMQDVALLEGFEADEFWGLVAELGIKRSAFDDRDSREARCARSIITAARFCEIQRDVRSRLPIRFRSRSGLITGRPPLAAARRRFSFPDEFNLYLAAGTHNMALPCAHAIGMRNLLVSYFYLRPGLNEILRGYREDPGAVIRRPPYAKYMDLIDSITRPAAAA